MGYKDKNTQREFNKNWIAKRRKEFFIGKTCINCGSFDRLELDHKDPSLKVSHRIWSWAKERRNKELEKCQVLCYNCHKTKTREWQNSRRQHGLTLYRYGCRCLVCYSAKQAHNLRSHPERMSA